MLGKYVASSSCSRSDTPSSSADSVPFDTVEQAIADIRGGQARHRRRRRGSRERGRSHLRGAARHAGDGQLHDQEGGRHDLPRAHRRARRRSSASPPMAETQPRRVPHRVHGERRRVAALRRDDGHQRAGPRDDDSRRASIRPPCRAICATAATCSRSARATAACCSASGTRRRPSISRGSPACIPPASSARS